MNNKLNIKKNISFLISGDFRSVNYADYFRYDVFINSKGFALVLTLWVLAIISALVLTFTFAVNLNMKNASYIKDGIDEENYAVGAVNCIAAQLIYPDDLKEKDKNKEDNSSENSSQKSNSSSGSSNNSKSTEDSSKDKEKTKKKAEWYFKAIGDWYVNKKDWSVSRDRSYTDPDSEIILCKVEAEDARFPLSKLFSIKSMPNYPGDILSDLNEQAKEKSFKLFSVPQLLEISGVQGEVYDGDGREMVGFKKIFTEFSDGKIYVSKANSTVLSLIPKMEVSNAESISNNKEAITSFEDLENMLGAGSNVKNIAEKWLKLVPEYFRIKAYKDIDGDQVSTEAVVNIKSADIKFLYLRRG